MNATGPFFVFGYCCSGVLLSSQEARASRLFPLNFLLSLEPNGKPVPVCTSRLLYHAL